MTATNANRLDADDRQARRLARFTLINTADGWFRVLGLSWLTPMPRAAVGDTPRARAREVGQLWGIPLASVAAFLLAWAILAPPGQTSLGAIPGPADVWEATEGLHQQAVRTGEQNAQFEAMVEQRNQHLRDAGRADEIRPMTFTGAPSYYNQIWTSIRTVFFGFLLATIVAVPLGIVAGLSKTANAALTPIIQIFKPVLPLAWLPIVTIVVSVVYVADDGVFARSFLVSAITVTLCSLWPTLINTTLGVASIDRHLVKVSKVPKMSKRAKLTKLILPSALPRIFTGLWLSLAVGWMVLIAAEMLAHNSGLGKFLWDELQNGSSQSLARITVAVLTIAIIGFLLDRLMYAIQATFAFTEAR